LPPAPDLLQKERHNHKERVENPNANRSGQWRARHVRVTDLDDNQENSKKDNGLSSNYGHHISRQVNDDPNAKQRDLQCEFRVPIIPQTKTNFPSVVIDREVTRMCNAPMSALLLSESGADFNPEERMK
jgi:hypothetical protein